MTQRDFQAVTSTVGPDGDTEDLELIVKQAIGNWTSSGWRLEHVAQSQSSDGDTIVGLYWVKDD